MARFRLLTPDAQYADDALIERRTAGPDVDWDIFRERLPKRLPTDALAACDAMVVWHEMKIDRALLPSGFNLARIIVRAGVGLIISTWRLQPNSIPVCNTPDYGTSEVADHAIGLMLALKRGIASYHQHWSHRLTGLRSAWRRWSGGCAARCWHRRSRSDRHCHRLARKGVRMSVIAYDPLVSRGTEIAVGIDRKESLEELLAASDVVSLHCPLTPKHAG
jgi:phosphoglycerate dehydrogenase-like enzyme